MGRRDAPLSEALGVAAYVRDAVLIIGRDGRILEVNAAATAVYGRDRAALLRMNVRDLRAAEAREAVEVQMAQAEGGGLLFETLHRRADGSTFPVEVNSTGAELAGERVLVSVVRDVTERKQAERALAEGAAHLELVLAAGGMGGWEVDLGTGTRFRNEGLLRLCGLPAEVPVDHGEAFDALIHPDDRPAREAALRRALAGDGEYRCEFRIRRADTGEERWLAARGRALKGPDGRPERLVGVNFDVTERKAAEAALQASEERLRLALDAGRMAVWERDLTSDKIAGSPELNRLFGFPPDATPTAEDIRSRYHPGERDRLRRVSEEALARGDAFSEVEFRCVLPDGSVRWLMVRAEVQRDAMGQPSRRIGVTMDVTDRKRAEQARLEGEERLRLAIGAARMATWEYDARTGIATRSGHLVPDAPGLPREHFALAAWLARTHPEHRERLSQAFADAAAGRLERFGVEYRQRRAEEAGDGWMWIATYGAIAERDAATGEVLRLAGVAFDITERKEAEERQRLLMREVDHRAKNALAVVQAALRLTPKDEVHTYAAVVEGRVKALARAHTLLAEGRWSGADLRTLAEGELATFQVSVEQAGVVVPKQVELRGPAVRVGADAAQSLSMAIHELATNAVKHGALSAPEGVVRLSWKVDREAGMLRIRWSEEGGPPVSTPPARRGFGSRVIEATISGQLGGQVERRWEAAGLHCELAIPVQRALTGEDGATTLAGDVTMGA